MAPSMSENKTEANRVLQWRLNEMDGFAGDMRRDLEIQVGEGKFHEATKTLGVIVGIESIKEVIEGEFFPAADDSMQGPR